MKVLARDTFTLIMLVKIFRAIFICRHALPSIGADDLRDSSPFGRRLILVLGSADLSMALLRP